MVKPKEDSRLLEYTFKIGLLGDEGTGKSSLISKYISNKFETNYSPTLGVSILTKVLEIDYQNISAKINLIIWDIAGQNKYSSVRSMYFQGCSGVIFVYDVTREPTFTDIRNKWMKEFRQFSQPNTVYILVGNKKDLIEKVKIGTAMGYQLANEIGAIEFLETSAKSGENVPRMFELMVESLLKLDQNQPNPELVSLNGGK
jgi:small GTP-binding protein